MASTELIYLGRDNIIDLSLKVNGGVTSLSTITHAVVLFSGTTFTSVGRTNWFDWTSGTTGQLTLRLGGVTSVAKGNYDMTLLLFDAANTDGINWGTIPVRLL